MSGSNAGSTVNDGKVKRKVTLSEKGLACKIERLHKDRQSIVNKIKSVIAALKRLMENDDNATQVQNQLGVLVQLREDAMALHESLMPLIPQEEQHKQNEWITSINKYNQGFIMDVEQWLSESDRLVSRQESLGELPNTDFETLPSVVLDEIHLNNKLHSDEQHDALPGPTQDEIKPGDSISNVSSKKHGSKSQTSRTSTSSARVKAEADMAALLARQRLLQEKHDLEKQEEEIRKRKERLALEVEIAASKAKVDVLRASSSVKGGTSNKSDGMQSYMERGLHTVLKADADSFVPHGQEDHGNPVSVRSVPQSYVTKSMEMKQPENIKSQIHQQRQTKLGVVHNAQPNFSMSQQSSTQAPIMATGDDNNLVSIMTRQNEITAMLVQQQSLSSLPNREIQVFDGDPLLYHAFMRAFEHNVEEKTSDARDCLHFLVQYTRGQPRELVRSCQQMAADRGYYKAKSLLEEHFGNEQRIASAYMDKALSWPVIKAEDIKALQAYGLFLRGCCNAMDEIQYMSELNMPANMLTIVKKLPYKLRDKWRTVACDIHERSHHRATFPDIVDFVERQVKITADPVFGNIQDTPKLVQSKSGKRENC